MGCLHQLLRFLWPNIVTLAHENCCTSSRGNCHWNRNPVCIIPPKVWDNNVCASTSLCLHQSNMLFAIPEILEKYCTQQMPFWDNFFFQSPNYWGFMNLWCPDLRDWAVYVIAAQTIFNMVFELVNLTNLLWYLKKH